MSTDTRPRRQAAMDTRIAKVTKIKPIMIDLGTVANMLALSVSTVQRLVREENFPKPRQISANRVGWLLREVEEWAESRPVSYLPPPPNTGAKKPRNK